MILDTSAIMAVLLDEPERGSFLEAIVDAPRCALSAGTWIELSAIMTRRHGTTQIRALERLMGGSNVAIEPITTAQAALGWQAYRDFGIGTKSPAKLNFGDCFAYALAKSTGEPLLFKGDDFIHTDIVAAL